MNTWSRRIRTFLPGDLHRRAIPIAAGYVLMASILLLFSHPLLIRLFRDVTLVQHFEKYHEWVYIGLYGIMLYLLVRLYRIARLEAEETQEYLSLVQDIVVRLNARGEIEMLNETGCRLLACREDEVIGKNWFDLFIPKVRREDVWSKFEKAIAGEMKPIERYQNPIMTLSGVERLIAWHNVLLIDDKGRATGTLSSGEDITDQKRLEKEVTEISEQEQERIGQDLHDSIGQNLAALTILGQILQNKLRAKRLPEAADAAEIVAVLGESIQQVRGVARGLYPVDLSTEGLIPSLKALITNVESKYRVPCRFHCDEECKAIHPQGDEAVQLYRIAQEALTNAAKHAHARRIVVRLQTTAGGLCLSVSDDGAGRIPSAPTHRGLGLHIMQHRAHLIGATLDIRSPAQGGTVVTCVVPVRARDAQKNCPLRF